MVIKPHVPVAQIAFAKDGRLRKAVTVPERQEPAADVALMYKPVWKLPCNTVPSNRCGAACTNQAGSYLVTQYPAPESTRTLAGGARIYVLWLEAHWVDVIGDMMVIIIERHDVATARLQFPTRPNPCLHAGFSGTICF